MYRKVLAKPWRQPYRCATVAGLARTISKIIAHNRNLLPAKTPSDERSIKMKKRKAILSLVLVLSIMFLFSNIALANSEVSASKIESCNLSIQTESVPNFINEYINENAASLIYLNDSVYEKIDASMVKIGNGFSIYTVKDMQVVPSNVYYYPVLYNNNIISTIAIASENGKVLGTTSGDSFCEELNKLNYSNTYKIIDVDGTVYAYSKGKWLFLKKMDANDENIELNSICVVKSDNETISNIKSPYINELSDLGSKSTIQKRLSVDMVTQGSHPWCGAACCAMIINYRSGSNYDAEDVTVEIHGSAVEEGITNSEAKSWMQSKGYYSSYTSSDRTYDQVKTDIDAYRPIYAQCSRNTGSGKVYHAMVLRGYRHVTDNGNKYFHFRNPQDHDHMVSANNSTVTIVVGSRTYTWIRTIYNI